MLGDLRLELFRDAVEVFTAGNDFGVVVPVTFSEVNLGAVVHVLLKKLEHININKS